MNPMKRQKSSVFGEEGLKINMLTIKNIVKLEIIFNTEVNIEMLYKAYLI